MKRNTCWIVFVALVLFLSTSALAEDVHLTLLTHYSSAHPHGRALEEYVAEYEKLNPGVTIEMQFITNDMMLDRLVVGAATDTLPDIAHVAGYMLADLAVSQVIAPLPQDVVDHISDAYLPGVADLLAYDGKVWGYPTEYMPRAVVYNRNLFGDAGLPDRSPETWEELRQFAQRLTDRNPDGSFNVSGFGVGLSSGGHQEHGLLLSLAYPLGGRLLSDDGREVVLASQENADTLAFLRELVAAGYAEARDWHVIGMRTGTMAMTVAPGPYWRTEFLNEGPGVYASMGTGLLPVPEAGMAPAAAGYGWLFVVSSQTPHAEEVYKFLNWLNLEPTDAGTTRMGNVLAHLGSIPVTPDDMRNQEAISDQFMAGFVEAVAKGYTFEEILAPGAPQIYAQVGTAVRSAVTGVSSPLNALTQAQERIQTLLDQVYK